MMNSSIPPENSRFQNHAVPPPSEKDLPLEKDANAPVWLVNGKVQEAKFCTCFLSRHPMICVQDSFYTKEGKITDEAQIRRAIYQELRPYCQTGLNKRISNLLDLLRLEACSEPLPLHLDRIHVANGTLFLDGRFTPHKEYCSNRLSVAYCPKAKPPQRWLSFLDQLLYPEDIPTLQEFMGYCFLLFRFTCFSFPECPTTAPAVQPEGSRKVE